MGGVCQGLCESFIGAHKAGGKTYADGYPRCNTCALHFKYEGIWCQCCNNRLRLKSRYKYKEREVIRY